MTYKELEENWKIFAEMVNKSPNLAQENALAKRYLEQNITILNDILLASIDNLNKLNRAKTPNEIICMQARLTNEISQKLSLSAQRFLNASLGHIADYNDWLKAHCDLSTD